MRGILAFWLAFLAASAQAQGFPDRPLRVVVPFAPGGNADIVARIVAQGMGEELKQSVLVENRPGANAAIGAEAVARAAPNGLTLLFGTAESHALNPHLRKGLPHDPVKDLPAVGVIDRFPFALVASPKLPARTLGEFVAWARQNPGKLNYASWGNGSTSQIAFEQLRQAAGLERVDMTHVPFNGAAPAIVAVSGDSVQAFMVPLSVARPQAQQGRVGLLAVTSAKREDSAPEVPTAAEQGLDVVIAGWHVLAVPAGTPAEAVAALNRALNAANARPEVREKLLKAGVQPASSTPGEAQAMVRAEWRRWGEVARKAGLRPE